MKQLRCYGRLLAAVVCLWAVSSAPLAWTAWDHGFHVHPGQATYHRQAGGDLRPHHGRLAPDTSPAADELRLLAGHAEVLPVGADRLAEGPAQLRLLPAFPLTVALVTTTSTPFEASLATEPPPPRTAA